MHPIYLTNVELNNAVFKGSVDVYLARYATDGSLALLIVMPGTRNILANISIWLETEEPLPERIIHLGAPEPVCYDLANKGVISIVGGDPLKARVNAPQHIWTQYDDQNPAVPQVH